MKKHTWFEGWYFKQQSGTASIAVIPAFHIDKDGIPSASIQIITKENTYHLFFPAETYHVNKKKTVIHLGDNLFSPKGMRLSLEKENLSLHGTLLYSGWTASPGDIMGPFRFLPFLECRHGICSMTHQVTGKLVLNGKELDFTGGTGYTESDCGRSFPDKYLWSQCCFGSARKDSIMLSAATVPVAGIPITGCICAIYYKGRHYRLATYKGVRILRLNQKELYLKQGFCRLHVVLPHTSSFSLFAPQKGSMSRTIQESISCTMRFRFWHKNRLLFDVTNTQAAFERSGL